MAGSIPPGDANFKMMFSEKLIIQVFHIDDGGTPAFICGINGCCITIDRLESIEKEINENIEDVLTKGAGDYFFEAKWYPEERDEYGRIMFSDYWDLTEIKFEKMPEIT